MKLSARNVFKGTVKAIDAGPVNAEVIIEIAPGLEMTSILTKKSCERLGLKPGKEAYAIIKASSVIVGTE
jgi:molybdate transport system regulatory protein